MENPVINGLYVLILGMMVIFSGMLVIILSVTICGKIIGTGKKEVKKEEVVVTQQVVEQQPENEEIPAHVKAAIIAAISAYYFNSQSKCDFVVKKIKRF